MDEVPRQRKALIAFLGVSVLVLFLFLGAQNAFNNFLNPSGTGTIVVFAALSALAFLLFVMVLVLLVRNVLKLYADQSSRVLGSRLRTRMLLGAMLISFAPILFMFLFSYQLMNRSVDRWFTQPVTELRDDSNRMAIDLSRYAAANARVEAESLAASVPDGDEENDAELQRVLLSHQITLQGGFAVVYRDGAQVAAFNLPEGGAQSVAVEHWAEAAPAKNEEPRTTEPLSAALLHAAQRSDNPGFTVGKVDYALGTAWLRPRRGAVVVVGLPMPYGMNATVDRLRAAADSYWVLYRSRRQIRSTYMLLLLMITTLAFFASSWLALHLSKQVTRPVEALADAMDEIAAGRYAHRVAASATQELGELVRSFNHMAADLESSRAQAESSTVQLSAANAALESRRSELETLLETIPNGVVTLNAERRIVHANRAFSELMDPGGQQPFIGLPLERVFPQEASEVLDRLVRRSHRMGIANSELEMRGGQGNHPRSTREASQAGPAALSSDLGDTMSAAPRNLVATVALLEQTHQGERVLTGYVLVLEDVTELLRAQKQAAWKEVARRVAHEIKNPLTPVSLSAERIARHLALLPEDAQRSDSAAVIRKCSETIKTSVESIRALVDQFAALAEFPASRPQPTDLNRIVEQSLALFEGRLQNIAIFSDLADDLPLVMADPGAMKRALANLIDNAAEAMQHSLLRELRISTSRLENNMVELSIADTGHGITDDMRERLFLPYFSTRQRGTGLGLAIAAKIVQEHGGTIRAEKNQPAGARLLIELPVASASSVEPQWSAMQSAEIEQSKFQAHEPARSLGNGGRA